MGTSLTVTSNYGSTGCRGGRGIWRPLNFYGALMYSLRPTINETERLPHQKCSVWPQGASKGGVPYTPGYTESNMAQICTLPRFWDVINGNARLPDQSCSIRPWGVA